MICLHAIKGIINGKTWNCKSCLIHVSLNTNSKSLNCKFTARFFCGAIQTSKPTINILASSGYGMKLLVPKFKFWNCSRFLSCDSTRTHLIYTSANQVWKDTCTGLVLDEASFKALLVLVILLLRQTQKCITGLLRCRNQLYFEYVMLNTVMTDTTYLHQIW